jgi:hypothetical protein
MNLWMLDVILVYSGKQVHLFPCKICISWLEQHQLGNIKYLPTNAKVFMKCVRNGNGQTCHLHSCSGYSKLLIEKKIQLPSSHLYFSLRQMFSSGLCILLAMSTVTKSLSYHLLTDMTSTTAKWDSANLKSLWKNFLVLKIVQQPQSVSVRKSEPELEDKWCWFLCECVGYIVVRISYAIIWV